MPTLHPDFEIGGAHGATDAALRGRTVYAAGFTGPAARRLILNGNTAQQFKDSLAEACTLRGLIRVCAPRLDFLNCDLDAGVNLAISRGIPLPTVRADLINLIAEHDEETDIDTARKIPASATAAKTAEVYAKREAQIDAFKAPHG